MQVNQREFSRDGFSKVNEEILQRTQQLRNEKKIGNEIITTFFQTDFKLESVEIKMGLLQLPFTQDLILRVAGCFNVNISNSIKFEEEKEKTKVQNIVKSFFQPSTKFNIDNVKELSTFSQNFIYRIISFQDRFDFIQCLNTINIKPKLDVKPKALPFLSQFMDIASTRDRILKLLQELYLSNTNDLKNIRSEDNFTRAIGRNYLSSVIKECNLQHIKVPRHTITFPEQDINIFLQQDSGAYKFDDRIGINTDQVKIKVEQINKKDRFLTKEEIENLFILVKNSHYCDFNYDNFIPTEKDGLYIVDTELKSFSMEFIKENIGKLREKYIDPDNEEYFNELIQKMSDVQEGPCIYYDNAIRYVYISSQNKPWASFSLNQDTINKSKKILDDCHSIGFSPDRVFQFSMSEISQK